MAGAAYRSKADLYGRLARASGVDPKEILVADRVISPSA
jgi:hypothetical protein